MDISARIEQIPELLLPWYEANARRLPWRENIDPYRVWISEIMLQQTRVEAVRGYYTRFLEALPTIRDLAQVSDDRLLKLWEGLGYYNRAKNLKRAALVITHEYDGVFPRTHGEILALPGIGPYTAGAIASICFSLPYPAVDGNVLRVYSRVFALAESIDLPLVKKQVTEALAPLYLESDPAMLNQALMELGALVCLPNGAPLCEGCPLSGICCAYAMGTMRSYPVRTPKKARRVEEKTVFILTSGDKLAVHKRDDAGLLGGLWALPNVPGRLDEQEALEQAQDFGVSPVELTYAKEKKHIFTHVEWQMRGYYIVCREESPQFTWVDGLERADRVALPTAFRQFLED